MGCVCVCIALDHVYSVVKGGHVNIYAVVDHGLGINGVIICLGTLGNTWGCIATLGSIRGALV